MNDILTLMMQKYEKIFLLISEAKLNVKNYFVFLNNICIKQLKWKHPDQETENEKASNLIKIPFNPERMLNFVSSRESLFHNNLKHAFH